MASSTTPPQAAYTAAKPESWAEASSSSKPNIAAIVSPIVVMISLFALSAAATIFYIRRRNRQRMQNLVPFSQRPENRIRPPSREAWVNSIRRKISNPISPSDTHDGQGSATLAPSRSYNISLNPHHSPPEVTIAPATPEYPPTRPPRRGDTGYLDYPRRPSHASNPSSDGAASTHRRHIVDLFQGPDSREHHRARLGASHLGEPPHSDRNHLSVQSSQPDYPIGTEASEFNEDISQRFLERQHLSPEHPDFALAGSSDASAVGGIAPRLYASGEYGQIGSMGTARGYSSGTSGLPWPRQDNETTLGDLERRRGSEDSEITREPRGGLRKVVSEPDVGEEIKLEVQRLKAARARTAPEW